MSRSLLRETVGYRQFGNTQELPSRRRSFWALTTSLMAGNGVSETQVGGQQRTRSGTHPAVREIHKNAWLKRQISAEKKGTPFSKKGEKFWVVFCVHDDVEAFLEFYAEPKMGTIHKPLSAISLNTCLHVSPSIMGQDNEYQFAVTLQSEVIRLVAANWEQMIEWVESLQGKLREMNILSPKDNLYSKLPETKLAMVSSTRDPNSPLPPTPSTLAAVNQRGQNQNSRTEPPVIRNDVSNTPRESNPGNESHVSSVSSRLSVNGNASNHLLPPEREHSRGHHHQSSNGHSDTTTPTPSHSLQTFALSATTADGIPSQDGALHLQVKKPQINVKLSVDVNNIHRTSTGSIIQSQQRHHFTNNGPVASASTTVVVIGNGDVRIHNHNDSNQSSRTNCTASISVNCKPPPTFDATVDTAGVSSHSAKSRNGTSMVVATQEELRNGDESNNPCVSRVSVNYTEAQNNSNPPVAKVRQMGPSSRNELIQIARAPAESTTELSRPSTKTGKSTSSENIYEHIYIPDRLSERLNGVKERPTSNNGNHNKLRSQGGGDEVDGRNKVHRSSSQRNPEDGIPAATEREGSHARRIIKGGNGGSSQRSSSLGRLEHPSTSNPREHEATRGSNANRNQQAIEIRGVGNSTFFENNTSPQQLQGSPIDALIGCRSGEYRLRRDEYLIRMGLSENDNQSTNGVSQPSGESYENTKLLPNGTNVPLKEQQVLHLQMEINHPGGVRIILRKKDCLNSIAFVDYLGAVWVAGWKQTQFPVLYYAFHVGDQILQVAGVNVQSSIEASRAIKMVSSMQVEFIIRRLPYGKVFALKRSRDGEPLGLVAEGGSGEISEVLPDGLAAQYGLPPKGLSVDGQTPCNWYLTEVNNRPLSLMSKENEVKDRLNAVGKEISILVQPADLVKHLRKSLKSYKSFKDYVVG